MADAVIEGNAKAKEIKAEEAAESERVKKEREEEKSAKPKSGKRICRSKNLNKLFFKIKKGNL